MCCILPGSTCRCLLFKPVVISTVAAPHCMQTRHHTASAPVLCTCWPARDACRDVGSPISARASKQPGLQQRQQDSSSEQRAAFAALSLSLPVLFLYFRYKSRTTGYRRRIAIQHYISSCSNTSSCLLQPCQQLHQRHECCCSWQPTAGPPANNNRGVQP